MTIDGNAPGGARFLELTGIDKSFDGQRVLDSVDLSIEEGEFFTLLGPSGCGKTTLLRIIGAFETADRGSVSLRGRDLGGVPPERRPFNMVFQSYALFPHMTVEGNVGYGLRTAGVPRAEVARKVAAMLELVHLARLRDRRVGELSGGEQQRVALARALVNEPEVLLLDEPLGALDLKLRRRLQEELRAIQSRLRTTFVYVTHDQDEALTMSHRIGVMNAGELIQVGSPRDVYERPATRFVAEFVGDANMLPCKVVGVPDSTTVRVRFAGGGEATLARAEGAPVDVGSDVFAMIRPEYLEFVPVNGTFTGELCESVFLGTHFRHEVDLGENPVVRFLSPGEVAAAPGQPIALQIKAGKGIVVGAGPGPAPRGEAEADTSTLASAPGVEAREAWDHA